MTTKRDSRGRKRNYKKEYDRDHKPSKDKKDRAGRNKGKSMLEGFMASRGKSIPKGKDVDHKDGNPQNNSRGNIRLMDKSENRGRHNKTRTA
tara:strand:+ start:1007 stop:1282 length:276 start_codon:yes stop_codon:yes gene_type:complete